MSDSVSAMRRSEQPQPALGEAIRQLRRKGGVTQENLAHQAGITTGTLSLIERGHANPTWATVQEIAAALEVPLSRVAIVAEELTKKQIPARSSE